MIALEKKGIEVSEDLVMWCVRVITDQPNGPIVMDGVSEEQQRKIVLGALFVLIAAVRHVALNATANPDEVLEWASNNIATGEIVERVRGVLAKLDPTVVPS